jgi:chemotaxis protein methyltransferase CheR
MTTPARQTAPIEPPALGPSSLAAFGQLVRDRLGLEIGKTRDQLARKLWSTAVDAGLVELEPSAWVGQLERAAPQSRCWAAMADIVPNHETSFFRDVEQLQRAVECLVPDTGPVRMLSVGCSSGEEVYSLAMLLHGRLEALWGRRAEVWGVDVSPAALERARRGWFTLGAIDRAGPGPEGWQTRFLRPAGEGFQLREHVRERTRFHEANLAVPASLAVLGQFDVVLCRNVLIHFEQLAAHRAVATLRTLVKPNGTLVLGAAEAPLLGGIG